MNCPKCHEEIPEKFKFCPECGTSVSSESHASGLEADRSVGDLRTIGGEPQETDESIGELKTVVRAGGPTDEPDLGEPLAVRYELAEQIGQGGFAKVWKARDKKLGRTVAVKRLLTEKLEGTAGELTRIRFRREANAIAQLNHQNIVQVFDVGRDGEGDYLVMEWVGGGSVKDELKRRGKLPEAEALSLIRGLARGLAYAHKKNLVHRDIKPANILLAREAEGVVPKIVDFGLARAGADSDLSVTGYGMGTPYYMPPEQRRDSKSVNHTADIYALGKTFYEILTGDVPDQVDAEKVPPHLAKIILRCVKNNPEERYFSAEDLLKDIESGGLLQTGEGKARQSAPGNACPACGGANPLGVEFCQSCGTGLMRSCPECDRKNPVHKAYCGGCGTDISLFATVKDALVRMEKHRHEKRWSRVEKEFGLLPKERCLPGAKGCDLLKRVQSRHAEASSAIQRIAELEPRIEQARSREDWRTLQALLTEYVKWSPADEETTKQLRNLPAKIDDEDWEQTGRLVTERTRSADWRGVQDVCHAYLNQHALGLHVEEARRQITEAAANGVRQALSEADALAAEHKVPGALSRIEAALAWLPKEDALRRKRDELMQAMRRQTREQAWTSTDQKAMALQNDGKWKEALSVYQAYLDMNVDYTGVSWKKLWTRSEQLKVVQLWREGYQSLYACRIGAPEGTAARPIAPPSFGMRVRLLWESIRLFIRSTGPRHIEEIQATIKQFRESARTRMEEMKRRCLEESAHQAESLVREGKYRPALSCIEAALAVLPGQPALLAQRQRIHQGLLQEVDKLDWKDLAEHTRQFEADGDYAAIIRDFTEYIRNHPDSPNIENAKEVLTDATDAYREQVTQDIAGHVERRKFTEALRLLENALVLMPDEAIFLNQKEVLRARIKAEPHVIKAREALAARRYGSACRALRRVERMAGRQGLDELFQQAELGRRKIRQRRMIIIGLLLTLLLLACYLAAM